MANLADIKLLAMDVDGVLTDGSIIVNSDGSETKSFSALDGHGIRMWRRAGLLEVPANADFVLEGYVDPSEPLRREGPFGDHYGYNSLQHDYPVFQASHLYHRNKAIYPATVVGRGFAVAVANAVDEVKQYADYVTTRPGGSGAVREVIEHILKSTGKWNELMKRYLPDS